MAKIELRAKGYKTEANAIRKAQTTLPDYARWFIVCQDGLFYPVVLYNERRDTEIAPFAVAHNGISVCN